MVLFPLVALSSPEACHSFPKEVEMARWLAESFFLSLLYSQRWLNFWSSCFHLPSLWTSGTLPHACASMHEGQLLKQCFCKRQYTVVKGSHVAVCTNLALPWTRLGLGTRDTGLGTWRQEDLSSRPACTTFIKTPLKNKQGDKPNALWSLGGKAGVGSWTFMGLNSAACGVIK